MLLRPRSTAVSVCLSVRSHISETTQPNVRNFLCMLTVAVARSFSGRFVIRFILPVLWMMTSRFYMMGLMAQHAYSEAAKG